MTISPARPGPTGSTPSTYNQSGEGKELPKKDEPETADETPTESSRTDQMSARLQDQLEPPDPKPSRRQPGHPPTSIPELKRENEQLKAKMVVMEKNMKRNRDESDRLKKDVEEKARYEMTTQKLQEKVRQQRQEINTLTESLRESVETKKALEEEHIVNGLEREHLNEQSLDAQIKEEIMAKRLKDSEEAQAALEEEIEVLRQENEDFINADTDPEDRQSVSFLHLERENLRLREGLRRLKETADEMEEESKLHIEELKLGLDDLEGVKSELNMTKALLSDSESAKQALKEQVDAIDSAAEESQMLFEKIEEKTAEIARLMHELEDSRLVEEANEQIARQYEDEIQQCNDELDSRMEMLRDNAKAQDRMKQELDEREHLLQAFKGLLSEYQESDGALRDSASADPESDELGRKSRELLELNLKLQNTTAKSQNRTIDTELDKLKVEEYSEHLSILKLFLPSTFEVDRNPILALFSFKRILFKARMLRSLLRESLERVASSAPHDTFLTFDVMEKLTRVSAACEGFVTYINSCAANEFLVFEGVQLEIEPVERNINVWIEQLKSGDLNVGRCSTELAGALAIFADLRGKILPSTAEVRSQMMSTNASLVSTYFEHLGLELNYLTESLSTALLPSTGEDGNEEFDVLLRQLEHLISRAKSVKTVAGKAVKNLNELSSRCLVLGEVPEQEFEKLEELAQEVSRFVRRLGMDLRQRIEDESGKEALTLKEALDVLSMSSKTFLQSSPVSGLLPAAPEDFAASLTQCLSISSKRTETLAAEAGDHTLTSEFERNEHPWIMRAQAMKADKTTAPETEEMINNLRASYERQSQTLSEKDTTLEQQRLRIEILESRTKDSKEQATIVRGLESELSRARRERDETQNLFEVTKAECLRTQEERIELQNQIKALQQNTKQTGSGSAEGIGIMSTRDQKALQEAQRELAELKNETMYFQATIRYLREANRRARLPVHSDSTAQHAWLSAPLVSKPSDGEGERVRSMARDCESALNQLWQAAKEMKPVVVRRRVQGNERGAGGDTKTWRPQKTTSKYQLLRQQEVITQWLGVTDDLLRGCQGQVHGRLQGKRAIKSDPGQGIQIVGSPPRS